MNIVYAQRALVFFAALALVIGCESLPETRLDLDKNRLDWQMHYPAKPLAFQERTLLYEGEDVYVNVVVPKVDDPAYSYDNVKVYGLVRVFSGAREITDSVFFSKPHRGDVAGSPRRKLSVVANPGDTVRVWLNREWHFTPGEYWGFLDAGVRSRRFEFTVQSLPDSLLSLLRTSLKLKTTIPLWDNPYQSARYRESYSDSLREFTRELLALPTGAPFRQEALRQCVKSAAYTPNDSVLFRQVAEQYASEPRTEPDLAASSLLAACSFDFESDCWEQLATQSGNERVLQAVKVRRQQMLEAKLCRQSN